MKSKKLGGDLAELGKNATQIMIFLPQGMWRIVITNHHALDHRIKRNPSRNALFIVATNYQLLTKEVRLMRRMQNVRSGDET